MHLPLTGIDGIHYPMKLGGFCNTCILTSPQPHRWRLFPCCLNTESVPTLSSRQAQSRGTCDFIAVHSYWIFSQMDTFTTIDISNSQSLLHFQDDKLNLSLENQTAVPFYISTNCRICHSIHVSLSLYRSQLNANQELRWFRNSPVIHFNVTACMVASISSVPVTFCDILLLLNFFCLF